MIKFNQHNVTNGTDKARVWYSIDGRVDGQKAVTIYSKDYSSALGRIFADQYKNETDIMTDYFEKGRAVIFSHDPLYTAALAAAQNAKAKQAARLDAKYGSRAA